MTRMMSLLMLFIIIFLLVDSFQLFGKKDELPLDSEPFSKVRGVPEYLEGKYLDESFICISNNKVIKPSSVNDNFCDCDDGNVTSIMR